MEGLDKELDGMTGDKLRAFVGAACSEVGLRTMNMDDDETRSWILRNCERVGLLVADLNDDEKRSWIFPARGVSKDPPARPYYDVAPERTL